MPSKMTAAARKKISASMKDRWAERKTLGRPAKKLGFANTPSLNGIGGTGQLTDINSKPHDTPTSIIQEATQNAQALRVRPEAASQHTALLLLVNYVDLLVKLGDAPEDPLLMQLIANGKAAL